MPSTFQKDPEVSVAVCSLLAAGVGANLHASSTSSSPSSWTAAEQQQAIDRVHRIGQDEPVTAWRILAAGTVDARIAELIDAKPRAAGPRRSDGSGHRHGQLDALVTPAASPEHLSAKRPANTSGWVVSRGLRGLPAGLLGALRALVRLLQDRLRLRLGVIAAGGLLLRQELGPLGDGGLVSLPLIPRP